MRDMQALPRVRDSLSFLYVEHCRIEQEHRSIAVFDKDGKVSVPCASLLALLLGPGTSVTHSAMRTLAENGCSVIWVGEGGVRVYASGLGETRSARNLLLQVQHWGDPVARIRVIRRMYEIRFSEPLDPSLTLQQIRGREGLRIREAYARASRETGVPWQGRSYARDRWAAADPINRALSAANSCLYAICHAAIVSCGFSPALGFIHTGKMLSFVYDIADLYKTEIVVPLAFRTTADGTDQLETRIRRACREAFAEARLLTRVVTDLARLFDVAEEELVDKGEADTEVSGAGLWDPEAGLVAQGVNWGEGQGQKGESHGGADTGARVSRASGRAEPVDA